MLESAWQHAVLAWFVDAGWLEQDAAAAMLAWPHSGLGAHLGPAIPGEDRIGLLRVARYSARAPVAESRLRYDAERAEVEIEVCPTHLRWVPGGGSMTALGFITEPAVVRRILAHLDRRQVDPRAEPWTGLAAAPG